MVNWQDSEEKRLIDVGVLFLLVTSSFLLTKPQRQREGEKKEKKRKRVKEGERERRREKS